MVGGLNGGKRVVFMALGPQFGDETEGAWQETVSENDRQTDRQGQLLAIFPSTVSTRGEKKNINCPQSLGLSRSG